MENLDIKKFLFNNHYRSIPPSLAHLDLSNSIIKIIHSWAIVYNKIREVLIMGFPPQENAGERSQVMNEILFYPAPLLPGGIMKMVNL